MALPPITGKTTTKVGTPLLKNAMDLARTQQRLGLGTTGKFVNGFLLRAAKLGTRYAAQVLDFPGYVLFPGVYRNQRLGQRPNLAVPVGTRDDFTDGSTNAWQVADKNQYLQLINIHFNTDDPTYVYWGPQVAIDQRLLGVSELSAPLKLTPPNLDQWYLDDLDYFDYDSVCILSAIITSVLYGGQPLTVDESGTPVLGQRPANYFTGNLFRITENDLSDGWKLYPRRIVPLSQSGAGYNQRVYPGDTMPGLAVDVSRSTPLLSGTDRYCWAAQVFRQSQEVWGPVDGRLYDRLGERGMLISVGVADRSEFTPNDPNVVVAQVESSRVVMPTDIRQEYLHPVPAVLVGEDGAPDLPNRGTFLTPKPERAGNERGFVVFSLYDTMRDLGDSGGRGRLSSVLTTLLDGSTVSLKADWDTPIGEPVPTGTPGQYTQPWIIGTASIPTVDQGVATWTAYALVWESNYPIEGGNASGGNWALYTSDGDTVTRKVMNGGAPLVAFTMQYFRFPLKSSNYDNTSSFAAAFWMGGTKLVTAATQYPLPDNEFGEGRFITSATFDVVTGDVVLGGVIAETYDGDAKCWITVAQPEVPAVGSTPAIPAVFLATITEHKLRWPATEGKTYLSTDGGETWREYITDVAGPSGAFVAGNKLWAPDCENRFDQQVFG
jgi:hypothetical protein